MATKNEALAALPESVKDGLRALTKMFDLDWSRAVITTGKDAVTKQLAMLDKYELDYYLQNQPVQVLSIADKVKQDKVQMKENALLNREFKAEVKRSEATRISNESKKQTAIF